MFLQNITVKCTYIIINFFVFKMYEILTAYTIFQLTKCGYPCEYTAIL